jgi:hypothetical protein
MEPVDDEVEDVREAIFVRKTADVSVVTVPAISELLGVPALRQFLR